MALYAAAAVVFTGSNQGACTGAGYDAVRRSMTQRVMQIAPAQDSIGTPLRPFFGGLVAVSCQPVSLPVARKG